jgi:NADH dehydrogenase (ubiquinone) Fe-S protein 4
MIFDSKEAAIAFCERQGWEYEVEEFKARDRTRPKKYQGYGDNYSTRRNGLPTGGLRSEQGAAPAAAPTKKK